MYESNHIYKSRKGWIRHTWFALWAGIVLMLAGLISIVHALVPNIFPYISENIVKRLLEQSDRLRK